MSSKQGHMLKSAMSDDFGSDKFLSSMKGGNY
jgi:hypothetical protein